MKLMAWGLVVALGALGCSKKKESGEPADEQTEVAKAGDMEPADDTPEEKEDTADPGIEKLVTDFAAAADKDALRALFLTDEQVKEWVGCSDSIVAQVAQRREGFVEGAALSPSPAGDIVVSSRKTIPVGSETIGYCTSTTEIGTAIVEFGACKLELWQVGGKWYVDEVIGQGCGSSEGASKD